MAVLFVVHTMHKPSSRMLCEGLCVLAMRKSSGWPCNFPQPDYSLIKKGPRQPRVLQIFDDSFVVAGHHPLLPL
jgi:hypothetical protein